jgi:hypothetical protein
MNPLKVCTCRLVFAVMLGLLALGPANKAAAFELFSQGGSDDCYQVAQQCDCQKCDSVGHVRKDNLFKRSMHSLIGHLHALLPSRKACDEISCDGACDAMVLEDLIEMRGAVEAAIISPSTSSSSKNTKTGTRDDLVSRGEVDNARQTSGPEPVIVAPIGATGRAGNPKPLFSNQLEPNERPLEDLSRGRVRGASPRITTPAPTAGSKSTIIPSPIRNDNF